MKLRGAIFDWDGVIIDSHDQHKEAWFQLAAELGRPFTDEQFKDSFGMRNQFILGEFLQWVDPADEEALLAMGDRKEALYRKVLRDAGIEPLPGVVDLLKALQGAGVPCAVGSSTPHENIRTIMEITGIGGYFEAVSAAEDVSEGKPHPEVFLRAAEKIGQPPVSCVVFEDAHVGIEAGKRAGMKVVGVATTHPVDSLRAQADLVVGDLTGLGLTALEALLGDSA